jgi:RimJ/RimL family protein N-acetyltransferase
MPDTAELRDDVVILDRFTPADVEAHVAGEDEEHARRFGWHPARSTAETARAAIQRWSDDWENDGMTRAFAARLLDGTLVGGTQLRFKGEEVAQISYWIFPSWRRRGLAARVVRLACEFAFGSLGIERVEALIEPDNDASRRVLDKVGFVEEGRLRNRGRFGDERRDMILFSLLPSDL